MEAVAKLKGCPMSARKMRLVVDIIRGMEANKALKVLKFTNKEAARWLEKLLVSAIANWQYKAGEGGSSDNYKLYVKAVFSDEGAVLKRFQPAPFGRAHRIRKRTNHVTLVVENAVLLPEEEEGLLGDINTQQRGYVENVEQQVIAQSSEQ